MRLRYEICYALAVAPSYPADVARCFGFARAQDPRFTEHVCGFLRDTDQLNDFGFTTYAVCMRDLLAR